MLQLRKRFTKWKYVAFSLASFAACFIFYWYISQSVLENKQLAIFLPTYQKIFNGAYSIFIDNSERLMYDIFISVSRVAIGFIAAVIVSLPLGILIGSFSLFEAIFQPLIEFCRYIPVPALIPVLMAIFGIGEQAKIMLIFVGTFVQLTLMISDNISRVSMNYLHAAESMGATTIENIRLVIFPAASAEIFDSMRICHGWAWTYVVVAELIATNDGLGIRIMKLARFIQMPKVFFYIFILGLVGLVLDMLFRKLKARLFSWAES